MNEPDTTEVPMLTVPAELLRRAERELALMIHAGNQEARDESDRRILARIVAVHADLQDALATL